MQKLPGIFARDRSSMRKLVEWIVDTFVPPNAVMYQSWDEFILTMDENSKRLNYAQLYKELEEIRIEQKEHIYRKFQQEFKSLGGKFKHFHVELDMWHEEINKHHYAAILLRWIDMNLLFNVWISSWISSIGKDMPPEIELEVT